MSKEEAQAFAEKNGLIFIETSALNSSNVPDAFSQVASRILDKINNQSIDVNI